MLDALAEASNAGFTTARYGDVAELKHKGRTLSFGVGGDFPRGHQVDYVLGEWSDEERKALPERLKVFGDAILSFTTIGLERTMNFFNKK